MQQGLKALKRKLIPVVVAAVTIIIYTKKFDLDHF